MTFPVVTDLAGYRFLVDELRDRGLDVSDHHVLKACRLVHVRCCHSIRRGTGKRPGPPVHEDLVRREFTVDELGYDTLDAGTLADGWRFENGQPAYYQPCAVDQEAMRTSCPGHRPTGTRTVTAGELGSLLEAARH